jgi:hypothetical protein
MQFRSHLTIGVSFTHTAGEQHRIGFIKVLREFLDDGGLARWWELQIRQPPSDFRFPVRHRCATLGFRTA